MGADKVVGGVASIFNGLHFYSFNSGSGCIYTGIDFWSNLLSIYRGVATGELDEFA